MPQVTLKIDFEADGREETLHEFLCDWPGCPNVAVHVVGFARDVSLSSVLCDEHVAALEGRNRDDSAAR